MRKLSLYTYKGRCFCVTPNQRRLLSLSKFQTIFMIRENFEIDIGVTHRLSIKPKASGYTQNYPRLDFYRSFDDSLNWTFTPTPFPWTSAGDDGRKVK